MSPNGHDDHDDDHDEHDGQKAEVFLVNPSRGLGQRRSGFGLSLTQAEIGCTMVLLILMIITIGYNGGCSTALPPHYLKIIDPNIITDTYTEVTCLSRGLGNWIGDSQPLDHLVQAPEPSFCTIFYPPEKRRPKKQISFWRNCISARKTKQKRQSFLFAQYHLPFVSLPPSSWCISRPYPPSGPNPSKSTSL